MVCGKPAKVVRVTLGQVFALDVPLCKKCAGLGTHLYGLLRR